MDNQTKLERAYTMARYAETDLRVAKANLDTANRAYLDAVSNLQTALEEYRQCSCPTN